MNKNPCPHAAYILVLQDKQFSKKEKKYIPWRKMLSAVEKNETSNKKKGQRLLRVEEGLPFQLGGPEGLSLNVASEQRPFKEGRE